MMNKDVMAKTAQLDQFDEELYKVNKLISFDYLTVLIHVFRT